MLAGIIAMLVMIVAVDQLFWRPIVVWAQRFKLEELSSEKPQSWVLSLFERSALLDYITRTFRREREKLFRSAPKRVTSAAPTPPTPSPIWPVARVAIIVTVLAALALGLFDLVRLVLQLPVKSDTGSDWLTVVFSLLASFARTSASILIGAAWCLPLGILIGRSPSWSRRLQPIVQVAASFPAPVLFPLVTLLLSALHVPFTLGCVALMLLGSQWYILFNVIAGASAIPADLKEAGTVYRLTRNQRWFKLYIPCVFPYLVTGLLTAAGGAWNATIVSEYVLIKDHEYIAFGLGSLISKATNKGDFPLLTASVLTMALFVVTFNTLCWKRLYRLAERRYTLQT
jgi:NitT/TauT family transport system permease protein